MDNKQKMEINRLRSEGLGYRKIAGVLGISENTVKSYCSRHGCGEAENKSENEICLNCGIDFSGTPHRKSKKFCSDKCRLAWWKIHGNYTGKVEYICKQCGVWFWNYASKKRKYCSCKCYTESKRG